MVTAISGHAGTSRDSYTIGNGDDGYKYILINNNLGFTPGLRYNDTTQKWQFSNDGSLWQDVGTGGAGISCCPGYLGPDGYVLGMVDGGTATDWIPNDQTESPTFRVGDNTEPIVKVEFGTDQGDAALVDDGYRFYSERNGELQAVLLTEPDDLNTAALGDYTSPTTGMRMKTDSGDGYLYYESNNEALVTEFPNQQPSRVLLTEKGDFNTAILGDSTQALTSVKFQSSFQDGYVDYNGQESTLGLREGNYTRRVLLTEQDDFNTAVLGDSTQAISTIKFQSSYTDGYIDYDGQYNYLALRTDINTKYSLLTDGYLFSSGSMVYYNGTDHTELAIGNTGQVLVAGAIPAWADDISLPKGGARTIEIAQADTDTSGTTLTVSAGDAGSLFIAESASGGDLELRAGSRSGPVSSAADGDILAKIGDELIGGFIRLAPSQEHFFRLYTDIRFGETESTPTISQDDNTENTDGYDLTIKAQDSAVAGYDAGSLYLQGGSADSGGDGYAGSVVLVPGGNLGSGKNGNIFINWTPANTQCNNMENGIFMTNVENPPDGYDHLGSGGYLFSEDGALKWLGQSGTETVMGPAHPHCPRCGRDFATSWSNSGETLSICMWCLTDALSSLGVDENLFIIKKGR